MTDLSTELIRHADDVWRIAVRLLSDEDEALECYQQTFVDALRLAPDSVRNWKAVMCRIATCRAMDRLRQRYRNREVSQPMDFDVLDSNPTNSSLEFQEFRESVRIALSKLPDRQAEVFYLRHIEHRDPTEIARQLGMDPGHVRVLVHRAISQLRRTLPVSFQPTTDQAYVRNDQKD